MAFDPRDFLRPKPEGAEAPLAGTRAERLQRLQIGGFGILAMVLLVGLADAITNRAQLTEENAVPDAAPTVLASETPAPRDPLADAGVVPDVVTSPTPTASASPTPAATGNEDAPARATNAPLQ